MLQKCQNKLKAKGIVLSTHKITIIWQWNTKKVNKILNQTKQTVVSPRTLYLSTTLPIDQWPSNQWSSSIQHVYHFWLKYAPGFALFCVYKVISNFVYCELDLWSLISRFNRVYPLIMSNICTTLDQNTLNGLIYIVFTSSYPRVTILTLNSAPLTSKFNRFHFLFTVNVSAKINEVSHNCWVSNVLAKWKYGRRTDGQKKKQKKIIIGLLHLVLKYIPLLFQLQLNNEGTN